MKHFTTEKSKLTEEQKNIIEEFKVQMLEAGVVVELIGTRPNDR